MKKLHIEIDRYYYTSFDIKWNLTKSIVGRDGEVLKRMGPGITPEMLEADILVVLKHSAQAP